MSMSSSSLSLSLSSSSSSSSSSAQLKRLPRPTDRGEINTHARAFSRSHTLPPRRDASLSQTHESVQNSALAFGASHGWSPKTYSPSTRKLDISQHNATPSSHDKAIRKSGANKRSCTSSSQRARIDAHNDRGIIAEPTTCRPPTDRTSVVLASSKIHCHKDCETSVARRVNGSTSAKRPRYSSDAALCRTDETNVARVNEPMSMTYPIPLASSLPWWVRNNGMRQCKDENDVCNKYAPRCSVDLLWGVHCAYAHTRMPVEPKIRSFIIPPRCSVCTSNGDDGEHVMDMCPRLVNGQIPSLLGAIHPHELLALP